MPRLVLGQSGKNPPGQAVEVTEEERSIEIVVQLEGDSKLGRSEEDPAEETLLLSLYKGKPIQGSFNYSF